MLHHRAYRKLLLPTIIVYGLVTIVPLAIVLYLSAYRWLLYDPTIREFRGLGNYAALLSSPDFWNAMRVTLVFTVGSVGIEFLLAWGVALTLNTSFRGVRFIRAILIFPMVIAPIIVALTWRIAYDPDFGLINYLLSLVGLPGLGWVADARTALGSLILVDVWQWTPYISLILLSGLQSLPQEYYEAAEIDGASAIQTFWLITIPLLRQVMMIAIIFRTMGAFRAYDLIYGLTYGGPGNATTNASFYAYQVTFEQGLVGQGSAISMFLVLVIVLVAWYFLHLFEGWQR